MQDLAADLVRSRQAAAPDVQTFPEVDPEEVANDLNLWVRAAEAGQHDKPARDATEPDLAEQEIAAAIERRARAAAHECRVQLDRYDARIQKTVLTDAERGEIEAAVKSALADLESRINDNLDRLYEVWRDCLEGIDIEFQEFRTRNDLDRPPKIVSRLERLLRGCGLALLAIVGTLINGQFLAGRSDAGLAWIVQAAVWSLLNVGPAVWYARHSLPRLVSRGMSAKLLGLAQTCAFLVWMLALNLLTAHVREVFVASETRGGISDLLRRLAASPFALEASKSWFLAALGVGLSTVSAIIAAGLNDLYPGYGALGRRRAAAAETYQAEASRCSERLTGIRDTAVEDMRAVVEAIRTLEQESQRAADAKKRLEEALLYHFDHLALVHEQLCRRYREVNEHVRSSKVPKYFRRKIERPAFLTRPDLPAAAPPPSQEGWIQAIERMEHHVQTVHSSVADALPRYREVEEKNEELEEVDVTA